MELKMFQTLNERKANSLRRAAILKVMAEENLTIAIIIPYLQNRYNTNEEIRMDLLEVLQKQKLYDDIKPKLRREKLYISVGNELADVKKSSL
jgi:hypothetical protein